MAIFFTSDQHFGHRNIINYSNRPFEDVDDMNRGLIERHNSVVHKDDIVWHLGDFSLSEKLVPIILPQLNGTHFLVAGNHDACHTIHKSKSTAAIRRYFEYGFKEVHQEAIVEGILCAHMPYTGDSHKEDRYSNFRPKNNGEWLLHGHIHGLWKTNGKMINVGVDVWDWAPVHIETIKNLINK